MSVEGRNHYDVLGVMPTADDVVIKAAHQALVRVRHPDHGGSAADFAAIAEAWETLGVPARRAQYDQQLTLRPGQPVLPSVEVNGAVAEILNRTDAVQTLHVTPEAWVSGTTFTSITDGVMLPLQGAVITDGPRRRLRYQGRGISGMSGVRGDLVVDVYLMAPSPTPPPTPAPAASGRVAAPAAQRSRSRSRRKRRPRLTFWQVVGNIIFWTAFTAAAAWVVWNLVLPSIATWTR